MHIVAIPAPLGLLEHDPEVAIAGPYRKFWLARIAHEPGRPGNLRRFFHERSLRGNRYDVSGLRHGDALEVGALSEAGATDRRYMVFLNHRDKAFAGKGDWWDLQAKARFAVCADANEALRMAHAMAIKALPDFRGAGWHTRGEHVGEVPVGELAFYDRLARVRPWFVGDRMYDPYDELAAYPEAAGGF